MCKTVLLVLLAVVMASAFDEGFGIPGSKSLNIKLYFYDTGRTQNLPIKLADLVDSFIKQNGPNDDLRLDGTKLELGKTWEDYGASFGSTLIIKRGKSDFSLPPPP